MTKPLKKPVRRVIARKVGSVRKVQLPPRNQRHLRAVEFGDYNATIREMHEEVQEMKDVLLGRKPPPVNHGLLTLQEVADAYFGRASEMTMRILQAEREGQVMKNSSAYKFRTGELRIFLEMAKRAADLGSRRVTFAGLVVEAERTGRSSMVEAMFMEDDDGI